MKNKYGNYAGNAREFLKKRNLGLWSEVKAEIEDFSMQGLIAPAPEGTREVIYLKLPNGYNTAFAVDRIKSIEKTGTAKVEYKITAEKVEKQPTLPTVHVLGAGGTVASKIDYRTGAVKASFSTSEIVTAIPELTDIANIDTTLLFNIFSENMTSTHWKKIAKETAKLLTSGVDGVVITHGTDTMHYTSAALSFMLAKLPAP
nr:Glu-tRNA(Gln) amidotransferase GatDE subunit D [Candidatus Korarchaeota archaeon]NIU85521.1 Glu-tRNA(Gln) amidotransferase GatDE subunit D [Candidatus Thorarchaeota archaeon]NIW15634.1 Glu-tRNA(Gln) amidotransferase GatDE subunit D [Candidatus Thorarchaeota archaeon]NIW53569.1 Glu-tRNA(Gln) amidotransferase GatDE subunit D [Candidatus Korarchaeota archaeon]